jgi:hypothetical protein
MTAAPSPARHPAGSAPVPSVLQAMAEGLPPASGPADQPPARAEDGLLTSSLRRVRSLWSRLARSVDEIGQPANGGMSRRSLDRIRETLN